MFYLSPALACSLPLPPLDLFQFPLWLFRSSPRTVFLYAIVYSGPFQTPLLDSRIQLSIPKLGLRFQNSCLDSKTYFSIPKLAKTHQTIAQLGGIKGPPFATFVYCFGCSRLLPAAVAHRPHCISIWAPSAAARKLRAVRPRRPSAPSARGGLGLGRTRYKALGSYGLGFRSRRAGAVRRGAEMAHRPPALV